MQEPAAATRYRSSKERSSTDIRGEERGKHRNDFIYFAVNYRSLVRNVPNESLSSLKIVLFSGWTIFQ